MCYNCGCGMPEAGGPELITKKTFEQAAKAAGQTVDDAKRKTYEQLKKELEGKKTK